MDYFKRRKEQLRKECQVHQHFNKIKSECPQTIIDALMLNATLNRKQFFKVNKVGMWDKYDAIKENLDQVDKVLDGEMWEDTGDVDDYDDLTFEKVSCNHLRYFLGEYQKKIDEM